MTFSLETYHINIQNKDYFIVCNTKLNIYWNITKLNFVAFYLQIIVNIFLRTNVTITDRRVHEAHQWRRRGRLWSQSINYFMRLPLMWKRLSDQTISSGSWRFLKGYSLHQKFKHKQWNLELHSVYQHIFRQTFCQVLLRIF